MSEELVGAALTYGLRGLRVVPCHHVEPDGACSCRRRRSCDRAGKHPRIDRWDERATTEAATISAWWARWPNANVGVVTGAKSGVIVLDVDNGELGEKSLAELENLYGRLPEAPSHRTPGDTTHDRDKAPGRQLWFRHPGGRVKNSNGELGKHLDVKGDDGLVIVPPSIRSDGRYAWEEGPDDPPELPDPWPAVVRDDRPAGPEAAASQGGTTALGAKALEDETAQVAEASEGQRNDQLNRSAFKLGQLIIAGELDADETRDALLTAAIFCGLPADEARATIESGLAGGQRNPRADDDQPANRFRDGCLSWSKVLSRPSPEWLIDGLLVEHSIAVLVGREAIGKSFTSLAWGLCLATGRDWLGQAVRQGPVLYIASEGSDGLSPRLLAWSQQHGGQVPGEDRFEVYPSPVSLLDKGEVAELVDHVRERRFALVVVDTLNRSLGGGSENDPGVMGAAFEAVDLVRRSHDRASVLVLHHPREDGQFRGAKNWTGGAQTVIGARRAEGLLQLSTDPARSGKQKDGPSRSFDLQLCPVTLPTVGDNGRPPTSCVVERADPFASFRQEIGNSDAFLALVAARAELGSAVTGKEAADFQRVREMPERTFRAMTSALVKAKKITKKGAGSKATYRLAGE